METNTLKTLLLKKISKLFFVFLNIIFSGNMQKLMIDETLDTVEGLQGALIVAESHVSTLPKETPFHGFEER